MVWPSIALCVGGLAAYSSAVACPLCTLRGFAFCAAGELIQSPIRSRRGLPVDSSNLSLIRDSGLRSPTNRSVVGTENEAGSSDVVCAGSVCADTGSCSRFKSSLWMCLPGSLFNWGGDCRFRSLEGSHLGIKCRHRFYCNVRRRICWIPCSYRVRTFDRWHVGQARKARVRFRD